MFTSKLQWAIHHETDSQRQKVIEALNLLGTPKYHKQADRLESCCSYGSLHLSPDAGSSPRLWISRCGCRACPVCSRVRSSKVARAIGDYTRHLSRPRHVTLTVPAATGSLRTQIQQLKAAFKRLRRSALWKQSVDGGFYCVEITRKTADHAWHPHLHIIYGGKFLLQADLAEAWKDALGEDRPVIVWINAACQKHAFYLAKYVGKPAELDAMPVDMLAEYLEAVDGQRMVQPFGCAHGQPIDDKDLIDPPPAVSCAIRIRVIGIAAHGGNRAAARLLWLLGHKWPSLRRLVPAYARASLPPPELLKKGEESDWADEVNRTLRFLVPLTQINPENLPPAPEGKWEKLALYSA